VQREIAARSVSAFYRIIPNAHRALRIAYASRIQVSCPGIASLLGKCAVVGVQRTTGKIMSHKLQARKEKTTVGRSSSTVLLPANWSMLMVAKLLHYFANR